MGGQERAGGILSIDLKAIAANWRRLQGMLKPGALCAGVVKADAYGTGMKMVAPTLYKVGCRDFFVANLDEGISLRKILPQARIFVFEGVWGGYCQEFQENSLIPVLNTLEQTKIWGEFSQGQYPSALHINTGMNRLGLDIEDVSQFQVCSPLLLISHLACADQPKHTLNQEQLEKFRRIKTQIPRSFANSSGIFLGPDYHFDLARPGAAIYGISPREDGFNPLRQAITLEARILQIREIPAGASVGYGATWRTQEPRKIATLGVGYADGYLRALSNRGAGYIGGYRVPLVGRVSMDLVTFDITGVPEHLCQIGGLIELMGSHYTVDDLAAASGTIGYEVLTSLGNRYYRRYIGAT